MDDEALHPAVQALKTVCRCNNIKYRTIERAIRDGACTLHEVASCTGATTGHCGGTCTPDIQEMLDEHSESPAAAPSSAPAGAWWVRK
ncbi:MAG: (2Fe-2S)-binding protein [Thermoanaerobaculia bacterium]